MEHSSKLGGAKCAHTPCHCRAPLAEKFCSDYCEDQAARHIEEIVGSETGCGCGHAECRIPNPGT
jgi:hypothetical protein